MKMINMNWLKKNVDLLIKSITFNSIIYLTIIRGMLCDRKNPVRSTLPRK